MSLVVRYKFDGPDLTKDSSGNSNTLVNEGGVVSVTDPTYGTVASFDRSSTAGLSLSTVPAGILGASPRTVSFWVKRNNDGHSFEYIYGYGGTPSYLEWRAQFQSGSLMHYANNSRIFHSLQYNENVWYHVAVTYDGTTKNTYDNGSLALFAAKTVDTTGTGALTIGYSTTYLTTYRFDGYLSDFRIYDYAMSAAEISTLHAEGPNPPIVVDWVLDANSKYEISSKEHLINLMNNGTIYQNTGSVPPAWTSDAFIQTVDIDLENDSTNIRPIGGNFFGEYDGNGFTVSNWSYQDPGYSSNDNEKFVGFFSTIWSGTVKNFRLAGLCTLRGFDDAAGMVAGRTNSGGSLFNIEVDLSPGSLIDQGREESGVYIGSVAGYMQGSGTHAAITFRGEIDYQTGSRSSRNVNAGGITGSIRQSASNNTLFRNLGTFPSGIFGGRAGGIASSLINSTLTKALNAMTGDIMDVNSSSYIGGVIGEVYNLVADRQSSEYINSMKGSVLGTQSNTRSGGIVGFFNANAENSNHTFMNYMRGDVVSSNGNRAGGLAGYANGNENMSTSINAMNGFAYASIVQNASPSPFLSTVDTSYGLTFTIDTNSTTDPVVGLPTDPDSGLPIVDLSASDPDSVTHTFEFVFGNLPPKYNQLQVNLSTGQDLQLAELEIYDVNGANIALLGSSTSGATIDVTIQPVEGVANLTLDFDKNYSRAALNRVVVYSPSSGGVVTLHSADGEVEEIGVLNSETIQEFGVTVVQPEPTTVPGVIPYGAVMYVNAGKLGSYEEGEPVMKDLSGSSVVFDFQTTAPPLSGGGVDFSNGNALKLSSAISVQTISLWLKKVASGGVTIVDLRDGVSSGGESGQMENGNGLGAFFTGGTVYLNGTPSTYTDIDNRPNGEIINVVVVGAYPSAATRFTLFANFNGDYTYLTNFRSALFYDRALTAEEVLDNYNVLLSYPQAGFREVPPLTLSPRALSVAVTIGPVQNATAYKITTQEAGSSKERVAKTGFSDLEVTVRNLNPDTEYTFRLYSKAGPSPYQFQHETTVTTLTNSASSYDVTSFGSQGRFDLTTLDTTSVKFMSGVMNELFTTGDEIEIPVTGRGTKKSKFVNTGANVNISDSEALVAPFTKDAGAGQAVQLTLSDSTIVALSYDEVTEAITVGSTAYTTGESFVLDGKKATLLDL